MVHYLIEFRFFGKAKGEIKRLIWEVNKRFHIRPKHRPVPHVSLAGPFQTREQRRLVRDFKEVCRKYGRFSFEVEGDGTFEESKVVFINIKPSEELDNLRWELSRKIRSYCNLRPFDLERKFNFHATIAMKLNPRKFEMVKNYISKKPKSNYRHTLLRVAIIKNQKILYEYDFILKKLLNRREAKSREILGKTFNTLKGTIEPSQIEEIDLDKKKEGFFSRLANFGRKKNIFLISDTHFDHTNIIRYCQRPFKSTSEMNEVMLSNWNKTVKKGDIVFFLGDLIFGRGSREVDYWLKQLNGEIYFVAGNHEKKSKILDYYDKLIIKYKGKKFLLVHDPADTPEDWNDWVIAGHHHNNKTGEFPLVNKKTKKMNVSVELIDYTPIKLEELVEKIE